MAVLRKLSRGRGQSEDLDVFVREQHIALYRRLLDTRTGVEQRQQIMRMLSDEMAKLRGRSNDPDPSGGVPQTMTAP
jgi:hypothetical protein